MLRILRLPALWFRFTGPVGRLEYAVSGALLVPLKIAVDTALYRSVTGRAWPLTSYLHPSFRLRFDRLPHDEEWVVWALAAVTIPFLWIGISMTVRRCMDAGLAPGWSLLFFVPAVNYVMMGLLCCLPSRNSTGAIDPWTGRAVQFTPALGAWIRGTAAGAAVGLGMIVLSVVLLRRYGVALFVGAPFVIGALPSFLLNRGGRAGVGATLGISQLALFVAALSILMFALEGVLCLAMAYPLAVLLSIAGALLGREIARAAPAARAGAMAIALPLVLASDLAEQPPPLREVVTTVEIAAPPERVFSSVIAFPPLPPPRDLVFRLGIAYPVGARIEGHYPRATRYCEFSTGAFVEPITAWEPPLRLAFDVTAEPEPLREISPYAHVFAPHLAGGMSSERGEFRLVPLPGGRTRLEGRTWYTLHLWPQAYWTIWSDNLVHRIHRRVLEHVAALAVEPPS